jgi:hypothetical protein
LTSFSIASSRPSSNSIAIYGKGVKHTLRTEELSRDIQSLASHNDDLLAVEQLLSHSAGQPTKEVTLAIDCDLLFPIISNHVPHPSCCSS